RRLGQEGLHLLGGQEDLGGDQPGAEALGLLRLEALRREADALVAQNRGVARALGKRGGERPRRLEVEEVQEQIAARVLAVGRGRRPELPRARDAPPRQGGARGKGTRRSLPLARVLVGPAPAGVMEVRGREELEVGG